MYPRFQRSEAPYGFNLFPPSGRVCTFQLLHGICIVLSTCHFNIPLNYMAPKSICLWISSVLMKLFLQLTNGGLKRWRHPWFIRFPNTSWFIWKKQSIIAETTSLNLRYFKLGSGISNISVQPIDVIVWPKCLRLLSLKSRSLWGFIKMALWSLEPIGGSWRTSKKTFLAFVRHQSKMALWRVGTLIIWVKPDNLYNRFSSNNVLTGLNYPVTKTRPSGCRERTDSTLRWIWLYSSKFSLAPEKVVW
jgi:hypothetical protein